MITRTFDSWHIGELHKSFSLIRHYEGYELLGAWIGAQTDIAPAHQEQLATLKKQLTFYAEMWNEDELKFLFIAPLIQIADLPSGQWRIFTQRTITAEVDGIKLTGRVDFVLSSGMDEPENPYFFIHEYKQEKRRDRDPLAQLLAEMLAAQEQNQMGHPLYGCYVLGRFWFFVVLQGKEYAVSDGMIASNDVHRIVAMLRWVRDQLPK